MSAIEIFYLKKVCVWCIISGEVGGGGGGGWEFEIGHSWEQLTVNDAVNAVLIQAAPTRSGFVFWWTLLLSVRVHFTW